LVLAFIALDRSPTPPEYSDGVATEESAEFTQKIQSFVLKNIGQPIEGFSAPIYLQAFPGLMKADFDNVETAEGKYVYSDNELIFTITQTRHISSVGEMILNNGYKTLLSNLRARLGNDLNVEEIVNRIIAQGLGNVHGTILRGPICPVMKDPPEEECADQPVFGTFIVKDVAGINEITRFSTQRDGSFTITLPVGEYSIESEIPLGLPVIQAHRIEVYANEKSEYTITFDTGIR
jgi:hypothetical protein